MNTTITRTEVPEVISSLETFISQFNELISIAESQHPDRNLIKEKYGVLKVKLKHEQKKSFIDKHFYSATETEQNFYFPAVCEAANVLHVSIGGKINADFITSLYDAQDQINYYLNNLRGA